MLENSKESSVLAQQAYADDKGIPWGISECAFAKMEDNGAYGYRAFGIPELALQQDEDRLVVAPYATLLALSRSIRPEAILQPALDDQEGWFGRYGYYEAADFTKDVRPSRRQRFALVTLLDGASPGNELAGHCELLKGWDCAEVVSRRRPRAGHRLLLQERPAGRVGIETPPKKKRTTKASARKPRPVLVAKS